MVNYRLLEKQLKVIFPDGSITTMRSYLKNKSEPQLRDDIKDVLKLYEQQLDNIKQKQLRAMFIGLIATIADTSHPIPLK